MSTLNVTTLKGATTIQTSGSTVAMTINSTTGTVGFPQQPVFLATSTSGGHSTGATGVLDFNYELLDNKSCYNTSTYRYTAPQAGWYYFYAQYWDQTGSTATQVAWRVNGSQYSVLDTALIAKGGNSNQADGTFPGAIILGLQTNDYVDLAVRQGTNTLTWYGGHSWFMGFLIG
jgi:hypothetical protein